MKVFGIIAVSSLLLLETCSAGLWGSNKVDPIVAEENLPFAPTSKFDYKLSFKKNFYYNGTVPFWSMGGGKYALGFTRTTKTANTLLFVKPRYIQI